ncbi:hypothetical protein DFJ74DRAFT_697500 [Hyaloraphidium curvatum]|nr:hypothetical protein DFJ74DRAFT_697500 [Hyaloraphidium curvatum]
MTLGGPEPFITPFIDSAFSAYWFQKCWPLQYFLEQHGVAQRYLWISPEYLAEGCCNFDSSDAETTRRITCTNGVLETIRWGPNELVGNLSDFGFIDHSAVDTALGKPLHAWKSIDFSGNPKLGGTFPRWFKKGGATLQSVNLSGTGLTGQLLRLDTILPNLKSLDVSGTKLSGFLPAMPPGLTTCRITPNSKLCSFLQSDWSATTPASCTTGLVPCAGKAPSGAVPQMPAPLRPHYQFLEPPIPGLKSAKEQCRLLKEWLVYHNASNDILWPGDDCCMLECGDKCPYLEVQVVSCLINVGPTYLMLELQGLTGDINEPPGTMSELKALNTFFAGMNKLTGSFPEFLTGMPDLEAISLSWNKLSGPIPPLAQLESLQLLDLVGNNFSGPVPLLAKRPSPSSEVDDYMGTCSIQGGDNKLCWEFDPGFYDETCAFSNPDIGACVDGSAPTITPARPTADGSYSCIRSCEDLGNYVSARLLARDPVRVQCAGPNATACSWYVDPDCSLLAPGEDVPRVGGGVLCPQTTLGWCGAAASTLASGNPQAECPTAGPWKCMRSCEDKGNRVVVRTLGNLDMGGTVQCRGPDRTKCSWLSDDSCTTLAEGEPQPDPRNEMGYRCEQLDSGWCKTAKDFLQGRQIAECGAIASPTTTAPTVSATTVKAGTATAVPSLSTLSRPSGASACFTASWRAAALVSFCFVFLL